MPKNKAKGSKIERELFQKFIEDNILQGGFLDIEISNDKLNLLFENYKSTFELVAQEFIKKIHYFHEIDKK